MYLINYSLILFLLLSKSILSEKRIKRKEYNFLPADLCSCDKKNLEKTNSTKTERMINAVVIPDKLIKSVVAIYARDNPASIVKVYCTGTLIATRRLITAATCVDILVTLRQENLITYAGAGFKHKIEDYFYNKIYEKKIQYWHRHENYNPRTRKNNIAIMTTEDFYFMDDSQYTIGYSCLYNMGSNDFKSNKLYGLGFGNSKKQIRVSNDGTSELNDLFKNQTRYRSKERPVNVDKANNETLGAIILKQIEGSTCKASKNEICTRGLSTIKITGACPGDNGSPLFGKFGRKYAILGVASRIVYDNKADQDTKVCGTGHVIYYEYTKPHLDWIYRTLVGNSTYSDLDICEPLFSK